MSSNSSAKKAIFFDLTEKEIAKGIANNLTPFLERKIREVINEFHQEKNVPIGIDEAAEWLSVSRAFVSKLISKGEINRFGIYYVSRS